MFCEKCGNPMPDTANFCEKCGAKVEMAGPAMISADARKVKSKSGKSKKILIALAVLLVIAVAGVGGKIAYDNTPGQKAAKQMKLGEKYLGELNYQQAKLAYEAAIAIDPKAVDAYVSLAKIYEAEKNYDEAFKILSKGNANTGDGKIQSYIQEIKELEANAENNNLNSDATQQTQQAATDKTAAAVPTKQTKTVSQPKSFTVMVDNSIVTENNGGKEFYAYLKSLLGDGTIDIKWVRPEHANYYDTVSIAFNSINQMPDVVLLSSDYYALYASSGFLWDMTDAWNASETKNSGRLISTADNVFNSLKVAGLDGKKRMYGFATYRGNGCCTYVKKSWLDAAGIPVSDVKDKTLTFDEYYNILRRMQAAKNSVVISAPGFIGSENPYTQYLPEFYQNAHFSFYQNSSGQYVDGFSEQAMKDALTRIQAAVRDGVLDRESVNNLSNHARDKFSTDNTGVFTYWAGTWADTLKISLEAKGFDGTLIAIKPIKELGSYIEKMPPVWCITTHAENPEGIFKYFIDTMLDGGDVQTAWEYGAKGTHWDTKAETVTLKGREDKGTAYAEGQFHMLPSPDSPNKLMIKNHIDPILALAKFKNGSDPGASRVSETAKANLEFFVSNSTVMESVPCTNEMAEYINDINKQRISIVNSVAKGSMSAESGIADYRAKVGTKVDEVLKSLNK
ncbi:MAG: extracellular solute-binding protein [Bacteroides sp.]